MVLRRIHVSHIVVGEVELDPAAAHQARKVLRLEDGTRVEVFDDAGAVAPATLLFRGTAGAAVRVEEIVSPTPRGTKLVIASAVPKGDRADWMVEKLSEIGVYEFIPLAAERSVVLPEGKSKRERWIRLATEAARQSRRSGVMSIAPLSSVAAVISRDPGFGGYLSTEPGAVSMHSALADLPPNQRLTLFIGPEGGWTKQEIEIFHVSDVCPLRLTNTILRVETAAILSAGLVLSR